MMKIESITDLPNWYRLGKYDCCARFKAGDWAANLESRAILLEWISNKASPDMTSNRSGTPSGWGRPDYATILEDTRIWPDYRMRSRLARPIEPLTHRDLVWIAREGSEASGEQGHVWRQTLSSIRAPAWSGELPTANQLNIVLQSGPSLAITIDLRASDALLLQAFSAWVKETRSQLQITTNRERPAYKDWTRYGLLPYLDLLIWSKESACHIPHHVMAQAVGYTRGGDSFRKTVPKLASSLMAKNGLAELEALASIEVSQEQPDQ